MTHAELVKRLMAEQDLKYRDFHSSLLPNIDKKTILGVRVPVMRKIAKDFFAAATPTELNRFLKKLPHRYFEENQVHLFVVERIKDFDECLQRIEQFLQYIDNWAVCDGKSPKALLKNMDVFFAKICEWLKSPEPYTVRFAVNMLMTFFLDERFDKMHLKLVANVDENKFKSGDRYYVQMVIAWYFATSLAKQWEFTFPYIKGRKLSPWIHAKSIPKAGESCRITDAQKEILRKLK